MSKTIEEKRAYNREKSKRYRERMKAKNPHFFRDLSRYYRNSEPMPVEPEYSPTAPPSWYQQHLQSRRF